MVLDFGLLEDPGTVQTADYKSAASHQSESLNYEFVTDAATWEEIYVVPAGKTYYVSAIVIASLVVADTLMEIGTGAGGSEATIFATSASKTNPYSLALPSPIKFSSGTRIAVKTATADDTHFTLIGWEE